MELRFLGVCFSREVGETKVLSPEIMRWEDGVVLFDLGPCLSYWRKQASLQGVGIRVLWEKILLAQDLEFCAVWARHPWLCALVLEMRLRLPRGKVICLDAELEKRFVSGASMAMWFRAAAKLEPHLDRINQGLKGEIKNCQNSLQRLQIEKLIDLSSTSQHAFTLRYGKILGLAWKWTFIADNEGGLFKDVVRSEFPWLPWETKVKPQVKRVLDYPLTLWEEIESLLREDLLKLCLSEHWDAEEEMVLNLAWNITLYHLQILQLQVEFRHPYSLKHEDPHFKTALCQLNLSFNDGVVQMQKRNDDWDLPEQIPFVGWSLEIIKSVREVKIGQGLFPENFAEKERGKVKNLENKLGVSLDIYCSTADFTPGNGYQKNEARFDFSLAQWMNAARNRPLFLFPKLQPVERLDSSKVEFQERSSGKWWEESGGGRDYYLYEDKLKRRYWVFCDSLTGKWFIHGVYS